MMNSIILKAATRLLVALLLLFSVYMLLRGHNLPGGGFIGGLIGATGFVLYAIAVGADATRARCSISRRRTSRWWALASRWRWRLRGVLQRCLLHRAMVVHRRPGKRGLHPDLVGAGLRYRRLPRGLRVDPDAGLALEEEV
jgi:hypothetical protein